MNDKKRQILIWEGFKIVSLLIDQDINWAKQNSPSLYEELKQQRVSFEKIATNEILNNSTFKGEDKEEMALSVAEYLEDVLEWPFKIGFANKVFEKENRMFLK